MALRKTFRNVNAFTGRLIITGISARLTFSGASKSGAIEGLPIIGFVSWSFETNTKITVGGFVDFPIVRDCHGNAIEYNQSLNVDLFNFFAVLEETFNDPVLPASNPTRSTYNGERFGRPGA